LASALEASSQLHTVPILPSGKKHPALKRRLGKTHLQSGHSSKETKAWPGIKTVILPVVNHSNDLAIPGNMHLNSDL
jgi:hypothetical protein